MKLEFNYTGRKKIHLNEVVLHFIENKGNYNVHLECDLARLDLDQNNKLYLEVSYQGFYQVIDCGTIEIRNPLSGIFLNSDLSEWIESVRCSIKVIDESEEIGLIRAVSPRITPSIMDVDGNTSRGKSFLPVVQKDIGEVPWKLEVEPYSVTLVLSDKLDDVKNILKNDPVKMSLIFPVMIREIAIRIFDSEEYSVAGDDWFVPWNKYFEKVLKITLPSEDVELTDAEKNDFVNNVVEVFCRIQKSATKLKNN